MEYDVRGDGSEISKKLPMVLSSMKLYYRFLTNAEVYSLFDSLNNWYRETSLLE